MASADEKKKMARLPTVTLMLILAVFVLLAGSGAFILFPQYRAIEKAREATARSLGELERQKTLAPLYVKARQASAKEFTPRYDFPERQPMKRADIAGLAGVLTAMALEKSLVLSGNSLDIKSLNKDSGVVAMDISLEGSLLDLHGWLVQVIALPFFDRVESIRIRAGNAVRTVNARIWITVD